MTTAQAGVAEVQTSEGGLVAVHAGPGKVSWQLERLAQRAWPALEERWVDGWLLRFSRGFTRRANSVVPLAAGRLPLTTRISRCETEYEQRGLLPAFRITPCAEPRGLDDVLAEGGYHREGETITQVCELAQVATGPVVPVSSWSYPDALWLAGYQRCGGVSGAQAPLLRQLLVRTSTPSLFVAAVVEGEPVSCAMGVLDSGYLGVFSVVTASSHQRRGYARACIGALADWARQKGGRMAHLQVLAANAPARRLYGRLGFRDAYQYWYRVAG